MYPSLTVQPFLCLANISHWKNSLINMVWKVYSLSCLQKFDNSLAEYLVNPDGDRGVHWLLMLPVSTRTAPPVLGFANAFCLAVPQCDFPGLEKPFYPGSFH